MANLVLNAVKAPGGLWMTIINWINASVLNFAWSVILFTLLIKLVLSPFDFLIKYSTKKSTLIQQKCAPQIEKLQKKYGNNQQQFQLQQQALYKKEGLNLGSSCLVMLANLIVTILVFFSIYTTLREASAYYAIKQYQELNTAYTKAYTLVLENSTILDEEYAQINVEVDSTTYTYSDYDPENPDASPEELKAAVIAAQANAIARAKADVSVSEAVQEKWEEVKDSWLWVANIWVVDGHAAPLPTYSDLTKLANNAGGMFNSGVKNSYVRFVKSVDESYYNEVTKAVTSKNGNWNGYYILAIAAGLVTFLSTWVSELGTKLKRDKKKTVKPNQYIRSNEPQQTSPAQAAGSMKFMKILLPVIMIIFVLSSSAAFGIYIVTQSVISIALGALINLIVNKLTYKKQLEVSMFLDKLEGKRN